MRQTWMVRPTRTRRRLGGQVAVAHRAQVAGVQLDPDHAAARPGGQRGPEAGGRLGQEGRDAAVEDPVGLVHLPVDREAHDDPLGAGLEDLDVEQLVDARRGRPAACARRVRRPVAGAEGVVVTAGC